MPHPSLSPQVARPPRASFLYKTLTFLPFAPAPSPWLALLTSLLTCLLCPSVVSVGFCSAYQVPQGRLATDENKFRLRKERLGSEGLLLQGTPVATGAGVATVERRL